MPEGENMTVRTAVTRIENTVAGTGSALKLALDRLDALGASLSSLAARIEALRRGMTLEVYTAPGTAVSKRVVTDVMAKRSDVEIAALQRSVEIRPGI